MDVGRIRTIKPEFPQSESMGRVSREARLCFIMLWTLCDDEGRTRANSRMLASLLYPYDDDAKGHLEGWLLELEREGCIQRYSCESDHYLQVLNWLSHQKIDHPSKSKYPTPRESSRDFAEPSIKIALDQGSRIKEGTKEHSEESTPEFLHPNQFANKLLEEIRFPQTTGNIRSVAAAIECEVKAGMSKAASYEFVLAGTLDGIDQGCEINTFFFTDAKYRVENRRNGNGGPSKNQQRIENNRKAILVGLGIVAEHGPDQPDLQDRDAAGGDSGLAKRAVRGKH